MKSPTAREPASPDHVPSLDDIVEEAVLNVVPPFRFAIVEEGVYRGAYPTLRNFPFLRGLELRTIVSLTPEEPTYDLRCFASAHGISLSYIQVERYKGEAQLLPVHMNEVLQLLMNVDRHPLYIHCLDGCHVVGLAIMGLRKLQRWDVNSSHLEYRRFTKSIQDEAAFIADYSGPVAVPHRIPHWLWNGTWCDAQGKPKRLHVAIRLKFPFVPLSPPVQLTQGDGESSVNSASLNDAAKRLADFQSATGTDDVGNISPIHPTPLVQSAVPELDSYVDLGTLVFSSPALLPADSAAGRGRHADMRFLSLRVASGAAGAEEGARDIPLPHESTDTDTHAKRRAGTAGRDTPLVPEPRETTGEEEDVFLHGTRSISAANASSPSGEGKGPVSALKYSVRSHHLVPKSDMKLLGSGAESYTDAAKKPKRRKSL